MKRGSACQFDRGHVWSPEPIAAGWLGFKTQVLEAAAEPRTLDELVAAVGGDAAVTDDLRENVVTALAVAGEQGRIVAKAREDGETVYVVRR